MVGDVSGLAAWRAAAESQASHDVMACRSMWIVHVSQF
jgi:hypothetical protein